MTLVVIRGGLAVVRVNLAEAVTALVAVVRGSLAEQQADPVDQVRLVAERKSLVK